MILTKREGVQAALGLLELRLSGGRVYAVNAETGERVLVWDGVTSVECMPTVGEVLTYTITASHNCASIEMEDKFDPVSPEKLTEFCGVIVM